MGAGLPLGHPPEREAQELQLAARGCEQEVALVLVGVGRTVQFRAGKAADIVPRRQRRRVQILCGGQQVRELDGLVAAYAGHGRLAGEVAVGEPLHHGLTESGFVVEHVMRDAQSVGDGPRIVDVLPGAAGALPPGCGAVVVELKRDADDIVPRLRKQCGRDGTVDAAGHGDNDPGLWRNLGEQHGASQ